jgi:prepilin-type N-terminal cleavage/methylation domain-containing protein
MKVKNLKSQKGFTLVEAIVSMAIFLLIVGVGIGVFLSISSYQRKILREQQLLSQISYTQEHISKALRMAARDQQGSCLIDSLDQSYPGYDYLLTRPVNGFYTGIKFLNQTDEDGLHLPACVEFYLDTATHVLMEKKTYSPYPKGLDSQAVAITSNVLNITSIRFGIDGYSGASGAGMPVGDQNSSNPDLTSIQPRVTFSMTVGLQGDNQSPARIVQTTVSQRNMNAK